MPEALFVEEKGLKIPLKGRRSNGVEYATTICIPHPFTYLVMKLFAFHDRQEDEKKQHGSHHAFDIFSIIGSLTEWELKEAIEFGTTFAQDTIVQDAKQKVQELFTGTSPIGMIAIKTHGSYKSMSENDYETFLKTLKEIFEIQNQT